MGDAEGRVVTDRAFGSRVEHALDRIDLLRGAALTDGGAIDGQLVEQALGEAATAVEELEVAIEEIAQQHQQLLETRSELEDERARYQILFQQAPDAYLVTDERGRIREANAAADELLASQHHPLVGRTLLALVAPHHRRRYLTELHGLAHGVASSWRMDVLRDGSPLPTTVTVSTDEPGGGLRWLLRDDSVRQATEDRLRAALDKQEEAAAELAEVDAIRRDLLLLVTHELRTPIASVLRLEELLTGGTALDQERTREALEIVVEGAQELARINEDLLQLQRAAAGRFELHPEEVELAHLVAKVVDQVAQGRDVQMDLDDVGSAVVDREAVRRILVAVLDNAVRHTPDDTPIGVIARAGGDDRLVLVVWDEGPGIPEQEREAVFELFRRGGRVRASGTGIGLHLVGAFTARHGGTVRAAERAGGGTEVVIDLATGDALLDLLAHDRR
jgi:PAS domain S-box-containing protein